MLLGMVLVFFTNLFPATALNDCYPEIPYEPETVPSAPTCQEFTISLEVGSETSNPDATTAFPTLDELNGWNILVKGTFVLNKTMSFKNCRIFFDEDTEMLTEGAVILIGDNTVFRPCENKTWNGIIVKQGGSIQLENGCGIWGADKGITLRKGYNGAQSYLIKTFFSRNRICIFSDEPSNVVFFRSFYENSFNGAGTLPGQPSVMPDVGIQIINGTALIGTVFDYAGDIDEIFIPEILYGFYANTFTRLRAGIELINSRAGIRNCNFEMLRPVAGIDGMAQSAGIIAIDSDVTVTGQNIPSEDYSIGYCRFWSCGFAGIKSVRSKLSTTYGQFGGIQYFGIHSTSNNHRAQIIKNNHFEFYNKEQQAGIFAERPGGAPWGIPVGLATFEIKENTFGGADFPLGDVEPSLSCIDVRCPFPNIGSRPALVTDNKIDMTGSPSGRLFGIIVYGNQSSHIKVLGNNVNFSSPTNSKTFGIFMTDCESIGHEVSSDTSTGPVQCNFHLQRSRNIEYCTNVSEGGSNGFHFMGDNLNAFWSGNNIGEHSIGLLIDDLEGSSGKIGPQTRRGNLWEANDNLYGDKAAKCNAADFIESLFLVEELNNNSIFPQKTLPSNGWFNFELGSLEYCVGIGNAISGFERKFAAGEIDTTQHGAAERWDLQRRLLRTLLDNPVEANDGGLLEDYLSQHQNSTAGRFAKVERMMADSIYVNATLFDQIKEDYQQYEGLMHDIDSLTHVFSFGTLPSKLEFLGEVADTIAIMVSDLDQLHHAYLQQVLDTLDAITVTQPYEQAWKTLKTYEIKMSMGFSPADAGFADLESISSYDPSTYGAAVNHAMQHLSPCKRYDMMVPPHESEEERVQTSHAHFNARTPDPLHLQPNPATEEVLVSFHQPMEGHWHLVAPSGQVVRTGHWAATQTTQRIDVSHLSAGVYFFRFVAESGRVTTRKVVVVR